MVVSASRALARHGLRTSLPGPLTACSSLLPPLPEPLTACSSLLPPAYRAVHEAHRGH